MSRSDKCVRRPPQVVIVLTDGLATRGAEFNKLNEFSKKLKESPQNTMIAVGVFQKMTEDQEEQLKLIGEHVFHELSFAKLIDHIEEIKRNLCPQ